MTQREMSGEPITREELEDLSRAFRYQWMEREARNPDLPAIGRLAYTVLLGEEDAVWPLIDEIMATKTPPDVRGLPTYHELLAALRMRAKVSNYDPSMMEKRVNDVQVKTLVKRCEGVSKVEAYLKPRKVGETR